MNNKNTSKKKLSGIRTFASDREHKEGVSPIEKKADSDEKKSETHVIQKEKFSTSKVEKNVPEVKKISVPEPKKKVIKENIVASDAKKPIPPPPTPKKPESTVSIEASNEDASSATIITDTKKDRFKLFPAITNSIKKWIENYKLEQKNKKAPKYTVPETARRKGVIQKATSQTGRSTSADHETIQDRIKKREELERDKKDNKDKLPRTNQDDENNWSEADNEPHTIWTPNTEPGVLLLEETSDSDIKNVAITPRKSFYTKESEIIIDDLASIKSPRNKFGSLVKNSEEKMSVQTEEINLPPIRKEVRTETNTPPPIETAPIPTPDSIKNKVVTAPDPVAETIPTPTPNVELNTEKKVPKTSFESDSRNFKKDKKLTITSTNTNTLAFAMAMLVLVIVGITFFLTLKQPDENTVITLNHREILNTDFEPIYQPVRTTEDLVSRIVSEHKKPNAHYFAFVSTVEKQNFIKPSAIMLNLGFRINSNFNQSISHIYFGSTGPNEPFVILNVTDYTVAISGMLEWERYVESDMSTIFELEQNTDADEEDITEFRFRDGMLSGKDVRVLKNEEGDEKIIYSIVDNHTIMITKNSQILGKLIELKK